jgi:hypothetical protein
MDIEKHFGEDMISKWKRIIASEQKANRLNRYHLVEAVQLVNEIITESKYGKKETLSVSDMTFTDNFFSDEQEVVDRKEITEDEMVAIEVTSSSKRKLSNILFNIYYPPATDSTYYHYTKISALKNILQGQIKLNPLVSNNNYNEFEDFYRDHNILGYFQNNDPDGSLLRDTLMEETYAFCMASSSGLNEENEKSLWGSFADGGHGVRITFKLKSNHPDFRKIFYRDEKLDLSGLLINRLNKVLNDRYQCQLFISGVSKIGAFYLPGDYKIENEVRFVVKKHTDQYKFHYDDSKGYLMLPLENAYGSFYIKKIKIGHKCTEEQRDSIVGMLEQNNYPKEILE